MTTTPHYEPVHDDFPDGWYWCEELERDAPPQLLRSYRPLRCNPEDSTFSVDTTSPRLWQRWTIGGWASVTGRVCQITNRPA